MSLDRIKDKSLGEIALNIEDLVEFLKIGERFFVYEKKLYKATFECGKYIITLDKEEVFSCEKDVSIQGYIIMNFHDAETVESDDLAEQDTLELPELNERSKTIEITEKVRDSAADLVSDFINRNMKEE